MLSPLSDRPSELSTRPTSVDPAILEAMSLGPTETIDSEMLGTEVIIQYTFIGLTVRFIRPRDPGYRSSRIHRILWAKYRW